MEKRVIWFIDENQIQLQTYLRALQLLMLHDVEVEVDSIFPPYPNKEDYISMLDDPATSTLIIDQKLKDTGIATYTGIELAQYLRGINSKLPIYILTNYVEEKEQFSGGEWSVDDIIAKSDLEDITSDNALTTKARILRRMDVYKDILGAREQRFSHLLRKSLNDQLNNEELKELEELQLERTSTILADELRDVKVLEELVEKHKELLRAFSQKLDQKGKK